VLQQRTTYMVHHCQYLRLSIDTRHLMYCINTNQSQQQQQQQQQQQVSKEGDTFEVPIEVAKLSNLVVTTLGEEDDDDNDDDDDDNMVEIPLPNVKSSVLAKVIEYCTHYNQDPSE
jgi:hypothetical protein